MVSVSALHIEQRAKWQRIYPVNRRADVYPKGWDRVTQPKHNILAVLSRYRFLTARQLRDVLGYSGGAGRIGSLTFVRDKTRELYHAGYINKLRFAPTFGKGLLPDIFVLDRKGHSYLKSAGIVPVGRERTSEKLEMNWLFLKHILGSNDLIIMCERLTRQDPMVGLRGFRAERDLRVDPIRVKAAIEVEDRGVRTKKELDIALVPDAWVDLKVGSEQACVAFELDRDTEKREKVQRKIYGYLEAFKGPYREKFGTNSVTVAFVASEGGQRRVEQLSGWIEEVLLKRGAEAYADLFRVCAFETDSSNPRYLFASIWRRPFDPSNFYPLLERS